jgi:hypothetical protein
VATVFGRKRRRIEQEKELHHQELIDKLELVERGDSLGLPYLTEYSYNRYLSRKEQERWYKAEEKIREERNFSKCQEELSVLHEEYLSRKGSYAEVDLLYDFYRRYSKALVAVRSRLAHEVGISYEEALDLLKAAVLEQYEWLLPQRQSLRHFIRLQDLIGRTHYHSSPYMSSDLRGVGIPALAYPEDWNRLVAIHFDTPPIEAFVGLSERGPGQVRLLAAEALKNDGFTRAQIALAYCNSNDDCREAVGDVLTAELAKLVTRCRAETGYQGYSVEKIERL